MQLTGQVFPHSCQFKGELMSFCTPGVWVGSKPFSKSPQCGVSLPLITEFNFNQEIFLNTWTHFSRDAASKWSNALMWPQKSSFILREARSFLHSQFVAGKSKSSYRTGQSFGCWYVIDMQRWCPPCWPWISLLRLHPCREHPFRLYLPLIFSEHQEVHLTSEFMKHQDMQK